MLLYTIYCTWLVHAVKTSFYNLLSLRISTEHSVCTQNQRVINTYMSPTEPIEKFNNANKLDLQDESFFFFSFFTI